MKHKDLVLNAKLWLVRSKSCNPVFCERGSSRLGEFPDAIGWTATDCFLIECKASVSDFNADKNKPFRADESGLGSRRYYCMTREIFEKVVVPEGWGVLICAGEGEVYQERLRGSAEFKRNFEKEVMFLRPRIFQVQQFGT